MGRGVSDISSPNSISWIHIFNSRANPSGQNNGGKEADQSLSKLGVSKKGDGEKKGAPRKLGLGNPENRGGRGDLLNVVNGNGLGQNGGPLLKGETCQGQV